MNSERTIWTVRVYERVTRGGRVFATRYHVLASNREEALALVKAKHEHPALPETHGSRYVADEGGETIAQVSTASLTKGEAERAIAAGLA